MINRAQGDASAAREKQIRRVIIVEGLANVAILVVKVAAGLLTGSLAILADAIHSLTDVANNVIAWFVVRASAAPPDREHPYGHRKFETLAVFVLATLLTVVAIEMILHTFRRDPGQIVQSTFGLQLMIGVLVMNVALATWQRRWATRLQSDILHADSSHTFADVLTTIVVIAGWQLSARGYAWIDTACAVGVAGVVLFLAFRLFQRAVPILVDSRSIDADVLAEATGNISGVADVRRVRSRWQGSARAVDLVIAVDPALQTRESHAIADAVEELLHERFDVKDVSVHVEPQEKHKS